MDDQNLPSVPEPIIVNTGEEEAAWLLAETFFTEVLTFLGYDERASKAFCCVNDRILAPPLWATDPANLCDSHAKLLVVRRDVIVASVISTRDAWNYVNFYFAHYLTSDSISRARFQLPE